MRDVINVILNKFIFTFTAYGASVFVFVCLFACFFLGGGVGVGGLGEH